MPRTKGTRIEDRRLFSGLTILLIAVWVADLVMRQMPAPISSRWSRDWIGSLYLSPSLDMLLRRPWTLLSYSLLHNSGLHLLLNLLLLWLFVRNSAAERRGHRLSAIYLLGAVVGGLSFVLLCSLLRACGIPLLGLPLVGASAAVIAVVGYVMGYTPKAPIPLPGIGSLTAWQVGALVILLLLLAYGGYNAGGLIAHLSGLIAGGAAGLRHRYRDSRRARQARQAEQQSERYYRLIRQVQQSGYQSLTEAERDDLIAYRRQEHSDA